MGTNYYFKTSNRDLVHKHFAKRLEVTSWEEYYDQEYELFDVPDFHYMIHLNKLSCGWKPLFQNHKAFKTFAELEKFYKAHKNDLIIEDEYGEEYTWNKYKKEILDHGNQVKTPMKWVKVREEGYCERIVTKECSPEEADLYSPFDHIEYTETYEKFRGIDSSDWGIQERYHRDPDYNIDWTEGDFR